MDSLDLLILFVEIIERKTIKSFAELSDYKETLTDHLNDAFQEYSDEHFEGETP
ncbi:MAG: hypothetical protein L3J71_03675 [Victivallaceae bacterium]|nr:hypothetical protein [Victivallaceae bacterium]